MREAIVIGIAMVACGSTATQRPSSLSPTATCPDGRSTDSEWGKDVLLFSLAGTKGQRTDLLTHPEEMDLVRAAEDCWSKSRGATTAGLLEIDIRQIQADGSISMGTDNWARATIFDGNFLGAANSDVSNAVGECVRDWLKTRRYAGLGSFRADFRLLPQRKP